MKVKDIYFKTTHDEYLGGLVLISGLALPDPKDGPFEFVDCSIHPRLWSTMRQLYGSSKFTNTYIGPEVK